MPLQVLVATYSAYCWCWSLLLLAAPAPDPAPAAAACCSVLRVLLAGAPNAACCSVLGMLRAAAYCGGWSLPLPAACCSVLRMLLAAAATAPPAAAAPAPADAPAPAPADATASCLLLLLLLACSTTTEWTESASGTPLGFANTLSHLLACDPPLGGPNWIRRGFGPHLANFGPSLVSWKSAAKPHKPVSVHYSVRGFQRIYEFRAAFGRRFGPGFGRRFGRRFGPDGLLEAWVCWLVA